MADILTYDDEVSTANALICYISFDFWKKSFSMLNGRIKSKICGTLPGKTRDSGSEPFRMELPKISFYA